MRTLYNILFLIFFTLSSPYYFWRMRRRGNWREGFRQRFGRYDNKLKQAITNRHILWMHAVSVGEMNVCTQVIRASNRACPTSRSSSPPPPPPAWRACKNASQAHRQDLLSH